MPYTIKSFQPTPNPNALKCVLDRPITRIPVSFRSAADLAADPGDPAASEPHRLAPALFAVSGVTGLLFSGDWVTVNKSPSTEWTAVKAGVTKALAAGDRAG